MDHPHPLRHRQDDDDDDDTISIDDTNSHRSISSISSGSMSSTSSNISGGGCSSRCNSSSSGSSTSTRHSSSSSSSRTQHSNTTTTTTISSYMINKKGMSRSSGNKKKRPFADTSTTSNNTSRSNHKNKTRRVSLMNEDRHSRARSYLSSSSSTTTTTSSSSAPSSKSSSSRGSGRDGSSSSSSPSSSVSVSKSSSSSKSSQTTQDGPTQDGPKQDVPFQHIQQQQQQQQQKKKSSLRTATAKDPPNYDNVEPARPFLLQQHQQQPPQQPPQQEPLQPPHHSHDAIARQISNMPHYKAHAILCHLAVRMPHIVQDAVMNYEWFSTWFDADGPGRHQSTVELDDDDEDGNGIEIANVNRYDDTSSPGRQTHHHHQQNMNREASPSLLSNIGRIQRHRTQPRFVVPVPTSPDQQHGTAILLAASSSSATLGTAPVARAAATTAVPTLAATTTARAVRLAAVAPKAATTAAPTPVAATTARPDRLTKVDFTMKRRVGNLKAGNGPYILSLKNGEGYNIKGSLSTILHRDNFETPLYLTTFRLRCLAAVKSGRIDYLPSCKNPDEHESFIKRLIAELWAEAKIDASGYERMSLVQILSLDDDWLLNQGLWDGTNPLPKNDDEVSTSIRYGSVWSDEEKAKAVQMRKDGHTSNDIAIELGRTLGSVNNQMTTLIDPNSKGNNVGRTIIWTWTPEMESRALDLRAKGCSLQNIGKEMGISKSSVQRFLARRHSNS